MLIAEWNMSGKRPFLNAHMFQHVSKYTAKDLLQYIAQLKN
jgi:hypothetical protein